MTTTINRDLRRLALIGQAYTAKSLGERARFNARLFRRLGWFGRLAETGILTVLAPVTAYFVLEAAYEMFVLRQK